MRNRFYPVYFFVFGLICLRVSGQPLAVSKPKFVGNIIGTTLREANFKKYWDQVTAENAGKWGSVESTPGTYNWTQLDNIYNFAKANGLPYKHHTLIWGAQQPSFMTGLDSANQYQRIVQWMDTTGKRYPNTDFVDVVNEPLHQPPAYMNALGGNGATGWDWVIKSFELARQHWPNAQLHINEYSVINDGTANKNYRTIINLLKERGLIDGIGVQGHHFEIDGGAPTTTLKNNLDSLAATGLPIYISELDINQQNDNTQLQRYQTIFPVLYEHPAVKGITLWGYVQYETWREYTYLITDRLAERPALQWLRAYLAAPFRPTQLVPSGTAGVIRDAVLSWNRSDSATSYHVQLSTLASFTSTTVDTTLADTTLKLFPLSPNTKYFWRVSAANGKGESPFSLTANFTTGEQILGAEETEIMPAEFSLFQNYPNPFNPWTTIAYRVPVTSTISLKVFNFLGQEIVTLFEGERQPGNYKTTFDGSKIASGMYVCRLTANNFVETKKLILLK